MNKQNKISLIMALILICGLIVGYLFHESKEQYEIRIEAMSIHNEWIESQTKVSSNITDICTQGSFNNEK